MYSNDQHYNDSTVAILIPRNFRWTKDLNFIVHFHGHGNNVANVLDQFALREELDRSGVNAILVVPQGPRDAADSDFGRVQHEKGGLSALLSEVISELRSVGAPVGAVAKRVVLTAHSGGYLVAGSILERQELSQVITDVLLFDASYGKLEAIASWVVGDPRRRLVSICTDHLGHENAQIIAFVQKAGKQAQVKMDFDLDDRVLAKRGCTIVLTETLEYNEVVSKRHYYADWLRLSGLPKRNSAAR